MHTIDLEGQVRHVRFIGIGGVSMSGCAEILKADGYIVSGSDENASSVTEHLSSLGIQVDIGHAAAHITSDMDLVVYTAAVKPDNPERKAAEQKGLRTIDRAHLLGMIMNGYARSICVSGTHGKTSTTAITAEICLAAKVDPTISIGGYMGEGYNFRVGHPPYFIMEACEYFDSFLQWRPYVGVILNIDNDHMDYFKDMERLTASFRQFAENIAPGGALIVYQGIPNLETLTRGLPSRVITYGEYGEYDEKGEKGARFTARNTAYDENGCPSFDIYDDDCFVVRVKLKLHGQHNILNALAAFAAATAAGVAPEDAASGLEAARGVKRRYEVKGRFNGATVVDDYAHHPTEIKAFLSAVRQSRTDTHGSRGRVLCAFQPHTYSRTRNLFNEFAESFVDVDQLLLLPIFASREPFDPSVSSAMLADKIKENGGNVRYIDSFDEAERFLRQELTQNDLLITMGAGDVYLLGERLLRTDLSTLSTDRL